MNQEKIGKFIKELRNEKKLTQQELALKLNVSDKAISKWENGRCLMDISLLKPLSDVLGVSILEIINGERIDNDNLYQKSSDVLKNTLEFNDRELKRSRLKTIMIMVISFFVIILGIYLTRQSYYWMKYPNFDKEYYSDISNGFNFRNNIKIYKKTLEENEYIEFGNLKIKNIFEKYILSAKSSDFSVPSNVHYVYFNDDKGDKRLVFSRQPEELLHSYDIANKYGDSVYVDYQLMENFYLENNIDDEVDFMNYVSNNGYKYSNLFTSPENMKFNIGYNNFIFDNNSIKYDYVDLISGDYRGYIRKLTNQSMIELVLIKEGIKYYFLFLEELANYDYIIELISSIEVR